MYEQYKRKRPATTKNCDFSGLRMISNPLLAGHNSTTQRYKNKNNGVGGGISTTKTLNSIVDLNQFKSAPPVIRHSMHAN